MTIENLVKHGFNKPQDMSLTEESNQVFLPGAKEHGFYMQSIKSLSAICIKYNIRSANERR